MPKLKSCSSSRILSGAGDRYEQYCFAERFALGHLTTRLGMENSLLEGLTKKGIYNANNKRVTVTISHPNVFGLLHRHEFIVLFNRP